MSFTEFVKAVTGSVVVRTRIPKNAFQINRTYLKGETYFELQTKEAPNGIVQELVEVEYPITPESVKSFVEETDYKKNPELLQANAGRKNLGDVTAMQDLQKLDMSAMRAQISALSAKLAEYEKNKDYAGNPEVVPDSGNTEVTNEQV